MTEEEGRIVLKAAQRASMRYQEPFRQRVADRALDRALSRYPSFDPSRSSFERWAGMQASYAVRDVMLKGLSKEIPMGSMDSARRPYQAWFGRERSTGLTPNQYAVLASFRSHSTAAEVAAALGLSRQTVKNHLSAIFKEFGVKKLHLAIAEAQRRGILSPA